MKVNEKLILLITKSTKNGEPGFAVLMYRTTALFLTDFQLL